MGPAVHVEAPPEYSADEIAGIRKSLAQSQQVFARSLAVSPQTVRAWEQGARRPDGAFARFACLALPRRGFRRFATYRTATFAAIASLALAIGACTAAFSLIDALMLRPLPVRDPRQLFDLARVFPPFMSPNNQPREFDQFSYPQFKVLRDVVRDRAYGAVLSDGAVRHAGNFGLAATVRTVSAAALEGLTNTPAMFRSATAPIGAGLLNTKRTYGTDRDSD